ncbi:helix-turn-helix transcriptional regulator [Agrobacterium sp. DE0009]|uniref:helix-turn-helix transcriptional regulator n=1 Tax=Agrobacterium sp. DE0009 TaxID=2587505 RepID=UPI0011A73C59|nr:LuxR C-terminal-related transcriptional regulator [Agrobacterium sp. DE0009]
MNNISAKDIIERIYEAALFPDRWIAVVEMICRHLGFWGGVITWGKGEEEVLLCTSSFQQLSRELVADGWDYRKDRLAKAAFEGPSSFGRDLDVLNRETWAALPVNRDVLIPRALGYGVATRITPPGHPEITISFERELDAGVIGPETMAVLADLRPHIARSLTIAAGLQRQKAEAITLGLNAIGAPAAVLQRSGHIVAANALFRSIGECLSPGSRDRIAITDDRANRLLYKALAGHDVASLPLPEGDDGACVLHVIPLRNSVSDFPSNGHAIALVAQPTGTIADATALLKGLYGLTKGEARIALEIIKGLSLPSVARQLSISHETVRSNAKSIYAKTGSTGKTDLMRRLSVLTRYNILEQR